MAQSLSGSGHKDIWLMVEYFAFFLWAAASATPHGVTDVVDVYDLVKVSMTLSGCDHFADDTLSSSFLNQTPTLPITLNHVISKLFENVLMELFGDHYNLRRSSVRV